MNTMKWLDQVFEQLGSDGQASEEYIKIKERLEAPEVEHQQRTRTTYTITPSRLKARKAQIIETIKIMSLQGLLRDDGLSEPIDDGLLGSRYDDDLMDNRLTPAEVARRMLTHYGYEPTDTWQEWDANCHRQYAVYTPESRDLLFLAELKKVGALLGDFVKYGRSAKKVSAARKAADDARADYFDWIMAQICQRANLDGKPTYLGHLSSKYAAGQYKKWVKAGRHIPAAVTLQIGG